MNNKQIKELCYGIIDKDEALLIHDDAFTGLQETIEATAEMLNATANLNEDDRAPYKAVKIYIQELQ